MIKAYLDRPQTRELLGVETPYNFSACSNTVSRGFNAHMDKWGVHTQDYVANLLDRGVRILIYAGTYDWQCNWVANKLWVDKLEWSGLAEYAAEEWRDWRLDGGTEKAGEVKETPLLTFVTIRGAGHMISHLSAFLACMYTDTAFVVSTCRMTSLQNLWRWYHDGWLRSRCNQSSNAPRVASSL